MKFYIKSYSKKGVINKNVKNDWNIKEKQRVVYKTLHTTNLCRKWLYGIFSWLFNWDSTYNYNDFNYYYIRELKKIVRIIEVSLAFIVVIIKNIYVEKCYLYTNKGCFSLNEKETLNNLYIEYKK